MNEESKALRVLVARIKKLKWDEEDLQGSAEYILSDALILSESDSTGVSLFESLRESLESAWDVGWHSGISHASTGSSGLNPYRLSAPPAKDTDGAEEN